MEELAAAEAALIAAPDGCNNMRQGRSIKVFAVAEKWAKHHETCKTNLLCAAAKRLLAPGAPGKSHRISAAERFIHSLSSFSVTQARTVRFAGFFLSSRICSTQRGGACLHIERVHHFSSRGVRRRKGARSVTASTKLAVVIREALAQQ